MAQGDREDFDAVKVMVPSVVLSLHLRTSQANQSKVNAAVTIDREKASGRFSMANPILLQGRRSPTSDWTLQRFARHVPHVLSHPRVDDENFRPTMEPNRDKPTHRP